MKELIEIILSYASIWVPSLVAMSGVVVTVCMAIKDTKDAIKELKKDDVIKNLTIEINRLSNENKEITKCYKALLDNITKIKDYVDSKKED